MTHFIIFFFLGGGGGEEGKLSHISLLFRCLLVSSANRHCQTVCTLIRPEVFVGSDLDPNCLTTLMVILK